MIQADSSRGKRDMALTPRTPLPREIVNRGKTGFASPVPAWISSMQAPMTRQQGLRVWAKVVANHFSVQSGN